MIKADEKNVIKKSSKAMGSIMSGLRYTFSEDS
jgi:hypothetical protein